MCAGHEVLMEVKDYFTLIVSDSQGSNQPMNSLANTRHMLVNVLFNYGIFLNWQNGLKKMLKNAFTDFVTKDPYIAQRYVLQNIPPPPPHTHQKKFLGQISTTLK
jgi:hypothetical protein